MVLTSVSLSYAAMDEVTVLSLLCLAMLAGCYLSGSVPLVVSLSEEKLQLVSVLGAGLLVGTALAVIIPEGVHSLYASQGGDMIHSHTVATHANTIQSEKLHAESSEHHLNLHSLIGLALVLGFVFMLVIDQIFGGHSVTQDAESGTVKDKGKMTATLGLVVHAAADGIALGAAATTSQPDVEMIVFIAIMLHKAPAAFGLVTFLMYAGVDRTRIRRHLLIFALAAPLMAFVTFFGLSQEGKQTLSTVNATGVAMLFSAGTFLYVATIHVLPEVSYRSHSRADDTIDSGTKGLRKLELFTLVIGALAPALLSIGHHH